MRKSVAHVGVVAIIFAFLGLVQSASAISYRFWWTGWDGGAVFTGNLEIDETPGPGVPPDTVYYWSLISFSAHWSGDANSQPVDWGIDDVGSGFSWNIKTHSITGMDVGTRPSSPGAFIDGPTFVDYRSIGPDQPNQYRTMTFESIQGQVVPDSGSTLVLLTIAIAALVPAAPRLRQTVASKSQP